MHIESAAITVEHIGNPKCSASIPPNAGPDISLENVFNDFNFSNI